jgi:holo-[acyl-carrier protein] synthase
MSLIGVDLIEVARVRSAISRYDGRFLNRIYTQEEVESCAARATRYLAYAARFAAKEAFFKALGTGLSGGVSWQDVAVVGDEHSRPKIAVKGKARTLLGERRVQLSLSHTREYAIAVVVIED